MRTSNTIFQWQRAFRAAFVPLILFLASRSPAPIYGLYGGLESLEKQSDAVMVVRAVRRLPGEETGMFDISFWELQVRKNLRGPLPEDTTFSANLRFLPLQSGDLSTSMSARPPGFGETDRNVEALLLGDPLKAEPGATWILFARNNAGLSQGTSKGDMHPLNNASWSSVNTQGAIIPVSPDLPLHTNPEAPVTAQVGELVQREWARRQERK